MHHGPLAEGAKRLRRGAGEDHSGKVMRKRAAIKWKSRKQGSTNKIATQTLQGEMMAQMLRGRGGESRLCPLGACSSAAPGKRGRRAHQSAETSPEEIRGGRKARPSWNLLLHQ